MKAVVFITGTNGVGKSTLAWALINRYGGIYEERDCTTFCNNKRYGFAGRYNNKRYGGVDRITNEKGSSCTSRLAEVVGNALRSCDVVFCEGSFMDTFGLNLTNALFLGDKALVVNLYCPPVEIVKRCSSRSNGRNGKRDWQKIINKQVRTMRAAQKYHDIGVKVLQLDTSAMTVQEEVEAIEKTLTEFGIII